MRTVKEVSELTGISVRTLHYYDEIGLLKPTRLSEAGYRLYDDKALETLQQVLFFREFDMPLKEIRSIMKNPDFDRNQILRSQKQMLEKKKQRLERLIAGMDAILKGDNRMDFEVFSKDDMEDMFRVMVSNMSEEQQQDVCRQYGSIEKYREHFTESASSEKAQRNFEKVVEWYGDKESAVDAVKKPKSQEITAAYRQRVDDVQKKLAAKQGEDVSSFAVKQIVGEYDFVMKQLFQMKDVELLMLDMAASYRKDEKMRSAVDGVYGEGSAKFIGEAIEAFYHR